LDKLRVHESELETNLDWLTVWQDQPFTGIAYDVTPDGQLGEAEYVNGVQHGPARDWYPSGQLHSEDIYDNGQVGVCREWFENGALKKVQVIENGILLQERVWDQAGFLLRDYTRGEQDPANS
jgi:antitoxin component YwqK of YwqJK toxin-antitoxin module